MRSSRYHKELQILQGATDNTRSYRYCKELQIRKELQILQGATDTKRIYRHQEKLQTPREATDTMRHYMRSHRYHKEPHEEIQIP